MSAGAVAAEVHPLITKHSPDYPQGLSIEGTYAVLDELDEAVVAHVGPYSPAITHGIQKMREVRDDLDSLSDSFEQDGAGDWKIRFILEQADFQLKNNFYKVNIGETN